MSVGPVELLVVKFPGNQFTGEIAPALAELVEQGTIRVLDIVFVAKDADGQVAMAEITDLVIDDRRFDPIVSDLTDLLSQDDADRFAGVLQPNSSAALMLFENTWATRCRDAVLDAKGEVLIAERIPKAVIDELLAAGASA